MKRLNWRRSKSMSMSMLAQSFESFLMWARNNGWLVDCLVSFKFWIQAFLFFSFFQWKNYGFLHFPMIYDSYNQIVNLAKKKRKHTLTHITYRKKHTNKQMHTKKYCREIIRL